MRISYISFDDEKNAAHDVELVFALLVHDVLVHLLEPSRERAPPLRNRTVPDQYVALARRRRDARLARMTLRTGRDAA